MKNFKFLTVILFGAFVACKSDENAKDIKIDIPNLPFEMPVIQLPDIPSGNWVITDFGAVSDGITNNQKSIQEAIDKCAEKGGGRVVFPKGLWLSGPIQLRSNTELHLEAGSILQFTDSFDDYPLMHYKYEKRKAVTCQPPIYGVDLENIAITGTGVIDGAGDAWRPVKKYKTTAYQWRSLLQSGGVTNEKGSVWYPSEKALYGSIKSADTDSHKASSDSSSNLAAYEDIKDFFRPVLIKLENCTRVLLDGPTFQNSPSWNIHQLLCKHVVIRNVHVRNPWYSQNGDGLDLESCSIGLVENCTFDVGDDAICIKSGKDEEGRDRNAPTEKVIIRNNIVYHGHGGFVIGSEMSGGVKDLYVTNCSFIGTDIGLRFKSARGRGGVVENIYITNIQMTNIPGAAIHFTTYYGGQAPLEDDDRGIVESGIVEVSDETPVFRNFRISDIICYNARIAVYLSGLDEMYLRNIVFDKMDITAQSGIYLFNVDSIQFRNVHIASGVLPLVNIKNSKNLSFESFTFSGNKGDSLFYITGPATKSVYIDPQYIPGKDIVVDTILSLQEILLQQ